MFNMYIMYYYLRKYITNFSFQNIAQYFFAPNDSRVSYDYWHTIYAHSVMFHSLYIESSKKELGLIYKNTITEQQ